MSTRCNIHFAQAGETFANIYRHSDGYPDGVLPDLQMFFAEVKRQCQDDPYGTRFNDPSYLAAKFVVWQAAQHAWGYDLATGGRKQKTPLAFGSLGIVLDDASDGQYVYTVHCDVEWNEDRFPEVTYEPELVEET